MFKGYAVGSGSVFMVIEMLLCDEYVISSREKSKGRMI